jgi:Protein of unknown function (DUF2975)
MRDRIPSPDPLGRLKRVSSVMAVAVTIGMAVVTLLVVAIFLIPALTRVTVLPEVLPFRLTEVSTEARWLGLAVIAVPLAVLLYALNEIRALFADYARGEILTWRAARRLKRIAWATIVSAILRAPARLGLFLAFTFDRPEIGRHLPVRIAVADFAFLLAGLLLLAVAWAMAEAARIAEEHSHIV